MDGTISAAESNLGFFFHSCTASDNRMKKHVFFVKNPSFLVETGPYSSREHFQQEIVFGICIIFSKQGAFLCYTVRRNEYLLE